MKKISTLLLSIIFCLSITSCNNEKIDTSGSIIDTPIISTQLPQVYIDTNGDTILDDPKIEAHMTILENDEVDFNGKIGIEIRGSSSQMFPKKQFGFEIWDDTNEGIDASLLGFPEEEDWILHAPYSDKTLLRNVLIYDLSREIGRYASRVKFVEVNINDSYNGVYVLMEKLKRDEYRIDINKLKPEEISGEDLTGGYILKIDKEGTYTNDTAITSTYQPNNAAAGQNVYFVYDTPKAEDIVPEQKQYITDYMTIFENALAGDNFTDPQLGYSNYINTDSFIDFFLLNEISNNVDGFRLSTWLTKDKNNKLTMGPIWDFNLAFGNANYCGGDSTNVWAYKFNYRCPDDFWLIPFWWERLLEDPDFVTQLQNRWIELRNSTFSNDYLMLKIDSYVEKLTVSGALQRNYETWPVLGEYVWPNSFVGNTYYDEIDYFKNWINNRLNWLDSAIMNL